MAETSSAPPGNPGDYLDLKLEPMRATLTILGTIAIAKLTLTREDVAKKLAALQVNHGIDWAMVDHVLIEKKYGTGYVIASGTPSTLGVDGSIEEKIKIDPDIHPVMDNNGKVDYKNVDNIHQVKKGEIIAIRTPPKQPIAGSDIFGKSLPVQMPKDIQFKIGVNTEVSSDGLQLFASTGGYVYHQAGAVCVGVVFVHKGDVDFKSGNLHYQGDIQVLGNVTTGFTVEAQGHVLIEGNVDAADVISHGGDVVINSTVFGHSKGRIIAQGNIHLLGAQDVFIQCENGTLTVDKSLRNCTVVAKSVKADEAGCSVVGGDIKAYSAVSIGLLGGEGCHTGIRIVDKDEEAVRERLMKIDKAKAELEPKISQVETRLKGMKAMAAKFGGALTDRTKADLKGVLEHYAALKGLEKELDGEKAIMAEKKKLAPKNSGKFWVTEKIIWGGELSLFGHKKELESGDVGREWVWTPEGLIGRTLLAEAPVKSGEPATGGAHPS